MVASHEIPQHHAQRHTSCSAMLLGLHPRRRGGLCGSLQRVRPLTSMQCDHEPGRAHAHACELRPRRLTRTCLSHGGRSHDTLSSRKGRVAVRAQTNQPTNQPHGPWASATRERGCKVGLRCSTADEGLTSQRQPRVSMGAAARRQPQNRAAAGSRERRVQDSSVWRRCKHSNNHTDPNTDLVCLSGPD